MRFEKILTTNPEEMFTELLIIIRLNWVYYSGDFILTVCELINDGLIKQGLLQYCATISGYSAAGSDKVIKCYSGPVHQLSLS